MLHPHENLFQQAPKPFNKGFQATIKLKLVFESVQQLKQKCYYYLNKSVQDMHKDIREQIERDEFIEASCAIEIRKAELIKEELQDCILAKNSVLNDRLNELTQAKLRGESDVLPKLEEIIRKMKEFQVIYDYLK
ncbi:hypothetical protein OXYTRIMIC_086 [Oxytricha trifallax]|uniref:Uncharacterized protein n=1 Tax=Oxytricha trifallax TaxID=1172189 RepID=A0A073I0H0_9SPIT|nr:hypothetical protein OXYTRIMIC_086 [Oxytricha trifallax]